jgi:hypothetical protein
MNARLKLLELERREQPAAIASLAAGVLTVTADADGGRIDVFREGSDVVVRSEGNVIGRFAGVTSLTVTGGAGSDIVRVDDAIAVPTTITGGGGRDKISTGAGPTTLDGGAAADMRPRFAGAAGDRPAASPGRRGIAAADDHSQ